MRSLSAFAFAVFALAACNASKGDAGIPGAVGSPGPAGSPGPQGPQGVQGSSGVLAFGFFFALMPPDNAATVAVGGDVDFPQDGAASGIVRVTASPDSFVLPAIGIYEISWQVSVSEAWQLVLSLNGTEVPESVAGRATGTSQITNHVLLTTTTVNSVLTVRNPAGNSTALTITPLAGGTSPASASLVIKRLR